MEPKINPKDLVSWYYSTLREKHYKPDECWGRDTKCAQRFIKTGRTLEQFKQLVSKALVGPKDCQIAVASGLHRFMFKLADIELLDEKPWEPSTEERQANIKILEAVHTSILEAVASKRHEKSWVKNPAGGWMRKPQ